MQNYNQQQQAVILKGIAQQLLQMNVPTFEQANKLFKEFEQVLIPLDFYQELYDESVKYRPSKVTNSQEDEDLIFWENYKTGK